MKKFYAVRNNRVSIGKCEAVVENFRKILLYDKESITIEAEDGRRVYHEVMEDETLIGIVSGYLNDPDHIKKVVNKIKKDNQISEVKAGDVIILYDAPKDYLEDYYIKNTIQEIEERFSFIMSYLKNNENDEEIIKYSITMGFINGFVSTGIYRNMENLVKCLEKCREISEEIMLATKRKQAVK